jgi:hypothetical protein
MFGLNDRIVVRVTLDKRNIETKELAGSFCQEGQVLNFQLVYPNKGILTSNHQEKEEF